MRTSTHSNKKKLDAIAESRNKWSVALSKTRMLTRWLELSRAKSLSVACDRGWISTLYMENRLEEYGHSSKARNSNGPNKIQVQNPSLLWSNRVTTHTGLHGSWIPSL